MEKAQVKEKRNAGLLSLYPFLSLSLSMCLCSARFFVLARRFSAVKVRFECCVSGRFLNCFFLLGTV